MVEKEVIEQKYPSEIVSLPSRGLIYPKNNPLSSGQVELKIMTAKEEDILTSQNLIQKGVVIDVLLKSLILSPVDYNDLYIGDKNAIMVAARILGYGSEYGVTLTCRHCQEKSECVIDLKNLKEIEPDESLFNYSNNFDFVLPASKKKITFKLLTHADEKRIEEDLKIQKKINPKAEKADLTTRLKRIITSVDGDTDENTIRKFVDSPEFKSLDSLELRKYIRKISPDVDMTYQWECDSCGEKNVNAVPMTVQFFWPNAGV